MWIHGLQRMTLLDFPGRVACTVFLGGCDLRCPFCHNAELTDGSARPIMDEGDLIAFLEKRRGLLDGVAITGGEPCLHPDLPALMGKIKAMGYAVKLDTNGAHPDLLQAVMKAQLVDYVAMDIKNSPRKYAVTAGLAKVDMEPFRRSVRLLMDGNIDYEFRTTAVEELHEDEDFEAIGAWIAGARRYFLQPFVARDTVPCGGLHAPPVGKLREWIGIVRRFVPECGLRGVEM